MYVHFRTNKRIFKLTLDTLHITLDKVVLHLGSITNQGLNHYSYNLYSASHHRNHCPTELLKLRSLVGEKLDMRRIKR